MTSEKIETPIEEIPPTALTIPLTKEDAPTGVSVSSLVEQLTAVDDRVRSLRKELSELRSQSFVLNHTVERLQIIIKKAGNISKPTIIKCRKKLRGVLMQIS